MNAYKFVVKDIYTNEKREFEYSSPNKDPRLVHKEGLKKIKYEGVTYFKSIEKDDDGKYEITNEDDIVGYMDDNDIIEFEDGYDEIHQDHEDYNP